MAHGLGYGVRARAEGRSEGSMLSLPREVDSWGGEGWGEVLGGIASSESQAQPFAGTECAVPRLREMPLGPLTGRVMVPDVRSQTVHSEGVLSGRVGQNHVRVVQHVQSIQGQGINLEFIQGELAIGVEADITNPSQCAGQFFREAGRGLSSHWGGGSAQKSQLSSGSPPHTLGRGIGPPQGCLLGVCAPEDTAIVWGHF